MLELRPYQVEAISSLRRAIGGGSRHPVLVAPTGSGKTVMAAAVIQGAMEKGNTVLFLAPRRELIYQADRTYGNLGIPCGVLMAGEVPDWGAEVQIASWDSLRSWIKKGRMEAPDADVVIVDECHLSMAPTYLEMLRTYWADKIVIGLTATPARGDGKPLGTFYTGLVQAADVGELTKAGHLVPVRYFAPTTVDLEGLRVARGDYEATEMARRVDQPKVIGDVVANWCRIASDRQTVVFCATVAHAAHLCERFREIGVSSDFLHCNMPLYERKEVLERVESGETQVVCNVDILTFGWDQPSVSCAVLARPTKSLVRYFQTVGRVLRPADGKSDAIVIDHGGVVDDLGMVDEPVPWSLDGDERVQTVKARQKKKSKPITCEACKAVYEGVRKCPECGHMPPVNAKSINHVDGDLVELDRERRRRNREFSWDEKAQWYGGLLYIAEDRGYKSGWAAHKYKTRFGVWPNDPRVKYLDPIPPSDEVRSWVVSEQIRWSKSKGRA